MAKAWRYLRWLPAAVAALGLLLAMLALWTDDLILDPDPCARPDDHPLFTPAVFTLTSAVGLAVINVPLGRLSRAQRSWLHSFGWVGLTLAALVLGMLFVTAGYGWHCP